MLITIHETKLSWIIIDFICDFYSAHYCLEPTIFISRLRLEETRTSELSLNSCKFLYKPLHNLHDNVNTTILLNGTTINNCRRNENNVTVSEKLIDGVLWEYKVTSHLISGYDKIGDYRCRVQIEQQVYLSEITSILSLPGEYIFS